MQPVTLRTARLVLDAPRASDVDVIAAYCTDPVFERYLTTPWPYRRSDAVAFIERVVDPGWASGTEFTWALRLTDGGPLLGVIGVRVPDGAGADDARADDAEPDFGYWLGAQHRGNGYLPEAARAVLDWIFAGSGLGIRSLHWEAVVGNTASASAARSIGVEYLGLGPAARPVRPDEPTDVWTGVVRADPAARPDVPPPSWPADSYRGGSTR